MLTSPFSSWHITFLCRLRRCFVSSQSFSFFGLIIFPPKTTQCLTRFQSIVLEPPWSVCWVARLSGPAPAPPPSPRSFSWTSSSSLGILWMLSSPPPLSTNNHPSEIQLFPGRSEVCSWVCLRIFYFFFNVWWLPPLGHKVKLKASRRGVTTLYIHFISWQYFVEKWFWPKLILIITKVLVGYNCHTL